MHLYVGQSLERTQETGHKENKQLNYKGDYGSKQRVLKRRKVYHILSTQGHAY